MIIYFAGCLDVKREKKLMAKGLSNRLYSYYYCRDKGGNYKEFKFFIEERARRRRNENSD